MRAWVLMLLLSLLAADASARPLSRDEHVLWVPDTARWIDDRRIEARLEAWVYEHEDRHGASALLARHLDLDLDALNPVDRERFEARTQLFRVDSESMKSLSIRVTGSCADCAPFALPPTDLSGRSSARILVEGSELAPDQRWLRFAVAMPTSDGRRFRGRALLVPARGLSVISDIDDTIKISEVRDRRQLLLNTFANAFVAVPDAARRYRALMAKPGAAIHYVSSSPIQLYLPLAKFLRDEGFPAGSVHLRESTAITNVIAHSGDSRQHKLTTIRRLLSDFPLRQFLLIGDSGEADPEIYAEIARTHRQQVIGIRIRDVTGETADADRYRTTFAGLPAGLWQIYADAATLSPAD